MQNVEQIPINMDVIDIEGLEEDLRWFDEYDIGDNVDDEPKLIL